MDNDLRKIFETMPLFTRKLMHDFPFHDSAVELNKTQQKALHFVSFHPKANMGEICRHMNMEKGSFTAVVDSLIDKGLIRRDRDTEDRRRINLSLTDAGSSVVADFERKMGRHLKRKLEKLNPEDMQKFSRAVNDLHEIVAKL